jgi:outer membrane protein OmpA-like peptidoglycan-associated protein
MNKLLFKQSTALFTEDSNEDLNSLYILLKENPTMVIQLEGHTDYRGNANLNLKLSKDRVEAVKKYLIQKGVKKNRIKLLAFGGTMPLSKEDTQEAQNLNRRVEVRILNK